RQLPGREGDRATDFSCGYLALAGGLRRWRDRVTGRTGAARPTRPSSLSYLEGGLVPFCGRLTGRACGLRRRGRRRRPQGRGRRGLAATRGPAPGPARPDAAL